VFSAVWSSKTPVKDQKNIRILIKFLEIELVAIHVNQTKIRRWMIDFY
jgi:hypothetical protein